MLIGVFIYLWGSFYHFPESVFRYITVTGSLSFAATLTVGRGNVLEAGQRSGRLLGFPGSAFPRCLSGVAGHAAHLCRAAELPVGPGRSGGRFAPPAAPIRRPVPLTSKTESVRPGSNPPPPEDPSARAEEPPHRSCAHP